MALGGRVHLLLQHALVDRADGVLRPAEDLGSHALGLSEREFGDRVADTPLDALRSKGDLVVAVPFAPLLRAVRVPDRHAHDRDRRVHTAERDHARDAATGTDDDLSSDLFPKDAVRRADVVGALGRHGRCFQAVAVLADCRGRLVHDTVRRRTTALEREIEANQAELHADDVGGEGAERFLEQFLPGLVAFEHDDRLHARDPTCASSRKRAQDNTLALLDSLFYSSVFARIELEGESNGTKDHPRM